MKKLISILICAAMVLSLIPAVTATGAEAVEQELESLKPTYSAPSTQGGTYSYDPDTNILSVTGMQTRRYATVGNHAPFAAIPFTANASGEYSIQLRTNVEATTSAAVNVYIITQTDGENNWSAFKEAGGADNPYAAILLGTREHSSVDKNLLTLAESIGYVNLAAAKKDKYVSATEYNTETGILGEKAGIVELTEGTAYYIIIAPDEMSRALNSNTSKGDLIEGEYVDSKTGAVLQTIGSSYTQQMSLSGIKLVPVPATETEDETAEETVSFAVTTNIPGETVTRIESHPRGQAVDMTQYLSNDSDYKFVGWMRGAYIEEDAQNESSWVTIGDTYNVWTNTFLTAVYEPVTAPDEKVVEFWNQNGAYIGKMDEATYNAQDELFTPKLTGFGTFLGWFTDGNVEFTAKQTLAAGTTNAVARYEASAVSNVTFDDDAITGADKYNADITLPATSDATTCWKRDGEIIGYGDTYKFNVWDETNITEGTEEITDKVPVAILDYSAKHKAYMLEYDAGDYEIVEAGIIFGKDTVNVKTYTSQRKEKHNQFTVPEEGTLVATGYIIYTLDDGASYKTKYVSVKTED